MSPQPGKTIDPEELRRIRNEGVDILLHLDISPEQYAAAGEPGYSMALVATPDTSATLFRMILGLRGSSLTEVTDEAARGVLMFMDAGEDRQAFMAPLMEALLMDTHRGAGGEEDPMNGFAAKVAADGRADLSR